MYKNVKIDGKTVDTDKYIKWLKSSPSINLDKHINLKDDKITKTLVGEDVEYFSRQCLYGGHMVRWSSLFNPIPICIGKFDKEKEPIFFNIPLLDQV